MQVDPILRGFSEDWRTAYSMISVLKEVRNVRHREGTNTAKYLL